MPPRFKTRGEWIASKGLIGWEEISYSDFLESYRQNEFTTKDTQKYGL